MAPRGRPKRKHPSESGTSVADSEEMDSNATSSSFRPRRSRLPKRYYDEEYSPPPSKRRATQRDTPSEAGDVEQEEVQFNIEDLKATPTLKPAVALAATPSSTKSTTKARGRPKKTTTTRRKSVKRIPEEDIIYMDEESEDDDESSDDDFILKENDPDDVEEELDLNLSDIKVEKAGVEEDKYCPWLDEDPETLPKLELPETSEDIPLAKHSIMDAIEIYEILRSYHRTLRITPFSFEDFCAALISRNNSCIMAECHMALLRVCLKSDDEEQIHYSVTETNNSVNIMFHHIDTLTYAEVLRQYIEAYPFADSSVREAINVENYPYVGYEPKLVVLLFMSYRFLYSSEFKKVVNNVGKFQNDENCRVCGKSSGRIVGCTQCEASFHVDCSHLKPFPDILICNICKRNNVRGVLPLNEAVDREPLRSQPIGRDRYGRYYWFIARRLIVQSVDEIEVHYYSTPPQLYQLLQKLDRNYYEKELCDAIRLRIDEFLEQMTTTVELTSERREAALETIMKKQMVSYEYADSTTPAIYLHKDSMKRMASILRDCSEKIQVKKEVKSEEPEENEDEDATRSSGPILKITTHFEEDTILAESMLGIFDGKLVNTFWSGGATQEELIEHYLESFGQNSLSSSQDAAHLGKLWKMGDEGNDQSFMQYYNYYSRNDMAENFGTRKKMIDKKKYMASKFAQIENFDWVVAKDRQFYGNSVLHNKFVGWTLSKIAKKIPADLMHRKWTEVMKQYEIDISVADDYKKLANCLLRLDCGVRKTIFMPQWWNGLGQTKLQRITLEQRDQFMKEQQRAKKIEMDALAKDLDDSFIRVNYAKPKWPNTYILRQRGETYRNAGKGAMGGWAWVSAKYVEKWIHLQDPPQISNEVEEGKMTNTISNRKLRRLELLVSKITKKRLNGDSNKQENGSGQFELVNKCYSPSCRLKPNLNCYSPQCRYGYLKEARERHEEEEKESNGILGEDKQWPIPEIQKFSTKKGGKSIFVLQKRILRQMILSGGCQQVYIPGFSAGIKSNLLIWPYPAPRPTLDLCWKWQTLNARSLHAVALQLKILWSSIKWNEFDPDDTHPDRRVVVDTPSHDERRRIIRHKEMPPYGQYERYEMEIEIIPLYEEQEEEDDSWLSRNRSSDCSQRTSSNRKKRPQRVLDNRRATAIRHEWVDGVTLKVYEIRDYWKWFRLEAEKAARRKIESARKVAKFKEDEERKRQLQLQKAYPITARAATRTVNSIPVTPSERIPIPYVGLNNRRSVEMNGNGRYLEKYNTSQIPPRSQIVATTGYPASSSPQVRHVAPNPIVRKMPAPNLYNQQDYRHQQHQRPVHSSGQRVAAGADGVYRNVLVASNPISRPYSGPGMSQQAMRLLSNGYQYPEGLMRGGGKMSASLPGQQRILQRDGAHPPFGEPKNEMRRVAEEAVVAKTEGSGGADEQPPVIPRYDLDPSQRSLPHVRQVYAPSQQVVRPVPAGGPLPPGARNVIYVKSADGGTQKMIVRPMAADQYHQRQQSQEYSPGTVIPSGTRIVSVRPTNQSQVRPPYAGHSAPRLMRVTGPTTTSGTLRSSEPIVRRIAQTSQRQMDYIDSESASTTPPQQVRYVLQGSGSTGVPKMTRMLPRGGMTMQMVQQQQQNPEHRRLLAGRQRQKVTTYRDFMASRGYSDSSKFMMQTKQSFLPFEFNEEEEREINEAIAREEEWMRLEEENRVSGYDSSGNPVRTYEDTQRSTPYVSNLLPSPTDSADDKIIKQVLDVMFSQVCRWDRQYGWSKTHIKRAKQKNDTDRMHIRKFRMTQRELLITEHMERLKKEINKRRTKMENEAEQLCGLLTPWRKARTRPHRASKPRAETKKEVINPADITLGGDTYDYGKEQKNVESIAFGVARRRRTSANLSKSEDDQKLLELSAPKPKERRTSESSMSRVKFYVPGWAVDIDVTVPHCTCQTMFDASKLYVKCEMCARWYHGECVHVTEQKIMKLEHWTCEDCILEQEKVKEEPALYCVCQKPYDDTKFYVGCDSCQGWFHPECVGTTREASEQAAEYNCPSCLREQPGYESEGSETSVSSRVSTQLTRGDYTYVYELLELLLEHRMSTPFRNPVDLIEFPDYEKYIKKPIDLSTISNKIEKTEYLYLSQFVNDVNQMFENAKTYNPKDHAVFKCAETMQEVFDKKLVEIKNQMTARQAHLQQQQQQQSAPVITARKRVQSESQKTVDSLDIDSDQLLPLDKELIKFLDF